MNKYVPTSFQNTTGAWWKGAQDAEGPKHDPSNGQFTSGGGSSGSGGEKKSSDPWAHENTLVSETEHHQIHKNPGLNTYSLKHKDYKPNSGMGHGYIGLSDPVNYQANATSHRVLDFRSHEEAKHASGLIGKNPVSRTDARRMKRQWDKLSSK